MQSQILRLNVRLFSLKSTYSLIERGFREESLMVTKLKIVDWL